MPALAPEAYNSLRTAWKRVVQTLGGVEATASCVRVNTSLVSAYGVVGSDRWAPIDVVLDAEAIAGEPHVTAALASVQGYALILVKPRAHSDLAQNLAAIGHTVAKLFAHGAEALADGKITENERIALCLDLDNVCRVAGEARQALLAHRPLDTDRE